jgi:prepilin-type N-terminal cleavage/methylation domain-containing protein
MKRGLTLVELLLSITIASILLLTLFSVYSLTSGMYRETRGSWYCMQSLRSAIIQLDADLKQCACLLPQDMKIACADNALFISGTPLTSSYSGITIHRKLPPPYFSTIRSLSGSIITLDAVDIDFDGAADYWADLGIITESGPCVISHGYSRGNTAIPLASVHLGNIGERAVPSIHYELKEDGLYRNNQLLAEAICSFETQMSGNDVILFLKACYHGEEKDISYTYRLQ